MQSCQVRSGSKQNWSDIKINQSDDFKSSVSLNFGRKENATTISGKLTIFQCIGFNSVKLNKTFISPK